jgi:hypothetical protein
LHRISERLENGELDSSVSLRRDESRSAAYGLHWALGKLVDVQGRRELAQRNSVTLSGNPHVGKRKGMHAAILEYLIDGCLRHWFESRGPECTALVYVDDAAGRLMDLRCTSS